MPCPYTTNTYGICLGSVQVKTRGKSTQTEVCATENLFQEAVGAASFPGRQPIRARGLASLATSRQKPRRRRDLRVPPARQCSVHRYVAPSSRRQANRSEPFR